MRNINALIIFAGLTMPKRVVTLSAMNKGLISLCVIALVGFGIYVATKEDVGMDIKKGVYWEYIGQWKIQIIQSKRRDRLTIDLMDNELRTPQSIFISCENSHTGRKGLTYVSVLMAVEIRDGKGIVTYHFDYDAPVVEEWEIERYFFKSKYPQKFLDKLASSNRLTISTDDVDGSKIEVVIDVRGFSKAFRRLKELCDVDVLL